MRGGETRAFEELVLRYQERSYERISEVLGVPVKTGETRLYRARKLLRERMAAEVRR